MLLINFLLTRTMFQIMKMEIKKLHKGLHIHFQVLRKSEVDISVKCLAILKIRVDTQYFKNQNQSSFSKNQINCMP